MEGAGRNGDGGGGGRRQGEEVSDVLTVAVSPRM